MTYPPADFGRRFEIDLKPGILNPGERMTEKKLIEQPEKGRKELFRRKGTNSTIGFEKGCTYFTVF